MGSSSRLGPAALLGVACAIYVFQVVLSIWWLRRFGMGPLERLWRRFTYGGQVRG